MEIINNTNCLKIEEARLLVLAFLKDDEFLRRVIKIPIFNHTLDTGRGVAFKIGTFFGTIHLKHYKPFNPWTKAIAYAEGNTIYFNSRKDFPVIERVETICHEICHVIGYSHKGNYVNKYNDLTVPYLVAKIFKEYLKEKNLA